MLSMNPSILRPTQAAAYIGISRRYLYKLSDTDPTFPRKIIITARCVGWRKESLDQWIQSKEGGAA